MSRAKLKNLTFIYIYPRNFVKMEGQDFRVLLKCIVIIIFTDFSENAGRQMLMQKDVREITMVSSNNYCCTRLNYIKRISITILGILIFSLFMIVLTSILWIAQSFFCELVGAKN